MQPPQLSFGIELEGVLVFHESLLAPYIDPKVQLKKNYKADDEHRKGKWPPHYRGWALEDPATGNLVQYKNEPVQIATELLQAAEDLPSTANGNFMHTVVEDDGGEKDMDISSSDDSEGSIKEKYNQWQITRDLSVLSLDGKEKLTFLTDLRFAPLDSWDSSDMEFISPVYNATEDSITNLKNHVKILSRHLETHRSTILVTETCGMHVHVGLPNDTPMPIDVLRTLAYITVLYEHEMTLVHEKHRLPNEIPIMTNRKGFKNGNADSRDYKFDDEDLRSEYLSIAKIRDNIFSDADEDNDQAYKNLKDLLCDGKQFVINWQNIDGKPRDNRETGRKPHTIEFRQHAGTFDIDAIEHWVRFCVSLVQLAYRLSDIGPRCFPEIETWNSAILLEDLLQQMDLPDATRNYYKAKRVAAESEGRLAESLWHDGTQEYVEADEDEFQ